MARPALEKAREAPLSTKARILAAAEAAFAGKGFDGASTREIAAAAGVNISSLHYHWGSKEALYFAVFQNIYDRIMELVRTSIPTDRPASRSVVDEAMGRLFDFFAEEANVPKLLVRRLLESGEGSAEIERDILVPAWRLFARWTQQLGPATSRQLDPHIFMLTMYSVLLLFLLDSRQFVSLLGGSARSGELRRRLRAHVINLVHTMVATRVEPA